MNVIVNPLSCRSIVDRHRPDKLVPEARALTGRTYVLRNVRSAEERTETAGHSRRVKSYKPLLDVVNIIINQSSGNGADLHPIKQGLDERVGRVGHSATVASPR